MSTMLQAYLAQIQEQLPPGRGRRKRILSEIEAHLQESWEAEQQRGISAEEALALALERFGSPTLIGKQFAQLEADRRLWQANQCWQRACLFLAPLLMCYVIAAISFLGYDAPRQAFIHFTDKLENTLVAMHAGFVGVLLAGGLILGGPLVCAISGLQGIINTSVISRIQEVEAMKSEASITWLNMACLMLGLAFLLFGLFALIAD